MKNIAPFFFSFILVLTVFQSFAQLPTIYKFKAVHVSVCAVVDGKTIMPPQKEMDVSALIVMNLVKDKLDIYSPKEQHIDIIKYLPADESNPELILNHFVGVDNDGDKCDIFYVVFTSNHPCQIWVRYPKMLIMYLTASEKK